MPTYNYAAFIPQAIASLRSQSYPEWECIVVDDGSTDNSPEVVAGLSKQDERIKYLRQENRRQAAARNTGIQHTTGKYVQFLDSDDCIEPHKFERQVAYLESHPEVDIVYSGVRYFTERGIDKNLHSVDSENEPWMLGSSGQGRTMIASLLRSNSMVINSPLTRRSVIEEVGTFDERLTPAEDWDYWLRCATAGKTFQFDDVEGTRALVRAHDISSSRNRVGMYKSMLLMRAKFAATNSDLELLALNRDVTASNEGYLGVEEAMRGNLWKGVRGILRAAALERKPRWRAKWIFCALAAPFVPGDRLRGMITTSRQDGTFGLRRKTNSRHG